MSEAAPVVSGVSGVFLESPEPKELADWYARTFGLTFNYWPERRSYGTEFVYDEDGGSRGRQSTVFVIEPHRNGRGPRAFKVQFRVANVEWACRRLKDNGAVVSTEEFSYGRFAQLRDADGNAVELYEPR